MSKDRKDLGAFQQVGKLFPEEAFVVSITPNTTVEEALRTMLENKYSQLPVVEDGRVRGTFSLWSVARHIENSPRVPIHELPVIDVMDPSLPMVTVEHNLHDFISILERDEAVLVSSPHGLQAIATAEVALRYFYKLARPFVLLGEIELALRNLISACVSEGMLAKCIERSIAKSRSSPERKQPIPNRLEEMTFEDYRTIVCAKENFPIFKGALGSNRELVMSKLERIRTIRNDVFHFKGDITIIDHETLAAAREWLHDKAINARSSEPEGTHEG